MESELVQFFAEYDRVCQRIEPISGGYSLPVEPQDDGSPHVEYDNGEYHYIVTERGLELSRRSTPKLSEIVFWAVSDMTFWMGVVYEFANRVDGQDVRRVIFAKWLELMKRAGPSFTIRLETHIAETLERNPYNDE